MSGISAGIFIKKELSKNPDITAAVEDKIFPSVVTKKIDFPFVIYDVSFDASSTKDGSGPDDVTASIRIASNEYDSPVQIAELVRTSLNGTRSKEYGIIMCLLEKGGGYVVDEPPVFVQELIFKITVL